MPTSEHRTLANEFLLRILRDVLAEPEFASSASALFDPVLAASMAAKVSSRALREARSKLVGSEASIVFEVLSISSRAALVHSIESAFKPGALAAFLADSAAAACVPERSGCALAAWRFPDNSFILATKAADDSFELLGQALLGSRAFLEAAGPQAAQAIARGAAHGWGSFGAIPLEAHGLEALLLSMADSEQHWRQGARVLDRDTSKELSPLDLLSAARAPAHSGSSLNEAMAKVFSKTPDRGL